MADKRKDIILLAFLLALLVFVNYNFLDRAVQNFLSKDKTVHIERVIDGDTVVTSAGEHIRLLGINAPETTSKEPYSGQAKDYLTNLIENKSVQLKFTSDKVDKYGRTLAYIFLGNENVNVNMVEEGFANYYFYSGRDKYSSTLEQAWNECLQNEMNLCAPSASYCAKCIKLERDDIFNQCTISCDIQDWYVKGEGREKIIFNGSIESGRRQYFNLSLAESGGSMYLRDETGNLVSWGIYK